MQNSKQGFIRSAQTRHRGQQRGVGFARLERQAEVEQHARLLGFDLNAGAASFPSPAMNADAWLQAFQ